MIKLDELFPIGQINKTHGVNGEMSVSYTSDVFDNEEVSFVVLEVEGIFVPFYINEYRFKSTSTALIKLAGVETDDQARELFGLTIYIQKKYLELVEDNEIEKDYFVGFSLFDINKGLVGLITDVDKTTDNTLFVIGEGADEILIPVGEEYIVDVDHDSKTIKVELPEGLLDL